MGGQSGYQGLNGQIAVQCAPLLAGLKPSNLLIIPKRQAQEMKAVLARTDFTAYCLTEYDDKQVYLVCRVNALVAYLTKPDVQRLLQQLGYEGSELSTLLYKVSERYTAHKREKAEFPHELGLLLGYPAVDVRGFMEHEGKNFLYSGYWKVYGNVRETVSLFREFGRAKENVVQLVDKGYSIADIAAIYYRKKAIA